MNSIKLNFRKVREKTTTELDICIIRVKKESGDTFFFYVLLNYLPSMFLKRMLSSKFTHNIIIRLMVLYLKLPFYILDYFSKILILISIDIILILIFRNIFYSLF